MFLLRSAFWLTVMFVIFAPKDFDLGKRAEEASQQAIRAGQDAIVAQIAASDCKTLECVGGKAALGALAGGTLHTLELQQTEAASPVPLPRPRPDRMG